MNWRKAHRNRARALGRKIVQIDPRYFMHNPDVTWKEWLEQLVPNVLNADSVFMRMLMRKPEPLATWRTTLPLPRRFEPTPMPPEFYPPTPDPARLRRYSQAWEDIWNSQNRQCAKCLRPVDLKDTAKFSHSFKIICQECYGKFVPVFMIVDDIDFSVPPPEPKPTKRFIYGDNWVAFRRIAE